MLFTGDYGHKDEAGFLYFHGRRDHLLKSLGARVNPSEVESLLLASGLVNEVAVFGVEHELAGHEICAAFVPAPGVDRVATKLRSYAQEHLSVYQQPRRFFERVAFPRTRTGKTDYPALRAEVLTRAGA